MSNPSPETSADPVRMTDALPDPPDPWERADSEGDIVEYWIPDGDGICTAAKIVVRPELVLPRGQRRLHRRPDRRGRLVEL